ncbi:MAG: hypothetical protein Phyf2KO_08980 [Phycisphaerales bacterium]
MTRGEPTQRQAARRIGGFIIGLLLIGVAVFVLARNKNDLNEALDAARHASWWIIALVIVLPVTNAAVVAVSFWILMRRFGSVPLGDMLALIGSAWLLNYLPMRPGLIGRLAFHKLVHGVSLKSSVAVSVALALMSGLAAAHMLVVGVAFAESTLIGAAVLVTSSVVVYFVAGLAADKSPAGAVPRKDLRIAMLIRYIDMLVWAVRMWACFAIVGSELTPWAALLIAAAVQIAYLFPLTGAGLGVVEWAVGVVAAIVVVDATAEIGIAASLANRAAEILVVVPCGLIGSAYIAKRRSRSARTLESENSPNTDAREA